MLPSHLNKVSRVHLFKCNLQVEYDVIPSRNILILLLSVSSKHKPKVAKEAAQINWVNKKNNLDALHPLSGTKVVGL